MTLLYNASAFEDFGPSEFISSSWTSKTTRISSTFATSNARIRDLRKQVKLLGPKRPGVYGMLDRHGQLIYVGKAKVLRGRLLSYFRAKETTRRVRRILAHASAIVWQACPDEFASLLRELELIRRWRPRCNVQGQPRRWKFTYLCLGRAPASMLFLAPNPPRECRTYVGPLASGRRLGEAVRWLNKVFKLRDCPQHQEMIFPEQGELFGELRPAGCLRLDIGTCMGPCTGGCSLEAYRAQVRAAGAFLFGETDGVLASLEAKMQAASAALQFELASNLRDGWRVLTWLARGLERLRRAQAELSFIYPLTGTDGRPRWYFIHGARTVTVADPAEAEPTHLAKLIRQVYRQPGSRELLASYEHRDSVALVMAWFRRYSRAAALTPAEALAQLAQS